MESRAYSFEDVKGLWRKLIRWMPQNDRPTLELHEYPADGLLFRVTARRGFWRHVDALCRDGQL